MKTLIATNEENPDETKFVKLLSKVLMLLLNIEGNSFI